MNKEKLSKLTKDYANLKIIKDILDNFDSSITLFSEFTEVQNTIDRWVQEFYFVLREELNKENEK